MMNYDKETCEAMEHMMNDASEKAEENAVKTYHAIENGVTDAFDTPHS